MNAAIAKSIKLLRTMAAWEDLSYGEVKHVSASVSRQAVS